MDYRATIRSSNAFNREEIERKLMIAHDAPRKLDLIGACIGQALEGDPTYAVDLASLGYNLATLHHDPSRAAEMALHRGRAHRATGSYADAIVDLQEALSYFIDHDDLANGARTAVELGDAESMIGEYREALRCYVQGAELAERAGMQHLKGEALGALGDLYASLGDYTRALEHYLASLALYDALDDEEGSGAILMAIGILYGHSGDYDAAFDSFQRSLATFRASGNRYQEVRALINLGTIHFSRGELETAMEHALRALAIYEALGDRANVGRVLVMIGNIHEKRGDRGVALEFQMRAYDLLDSTEDHELRVTILLNIARLHVAVSSYDDALFVLEQAIRIAEEIDDPKLQYEIHEALAAAYEHLGRPTEALDHYKRFARIRNELAGREKQKALAELQVRFDVEQAEREREIYRLRALQLESEMRSKQNELAAMALNLVQKKELLDAMRTQLEKLRSERQQGAEKAVSDLLQEIDSTRNADRDWKIFEQQLDNLHQDFIRTLSARYPAMTPTELKICSLARINLSSKDIANLLYTSIRTIQAHKYNIRKKLGLESGTSLTTFLAGL